MRPPEGGRHRMALPDVPVRGMQALGPDGALISRMAERLAHALRQDPEILADCPNLGFLEGLRAQLPGAETAILALEAEMLAQSPKD